MCRVFSFLLPQLLLLFFHFISSLPLVLHFQKHFHVHFLLIFNGMLHTLVQNTLFNHLHRIFTMLSYE